MLLIVATTFATQPSTTPHGQCTHFARTNVRREYTITDGEYWDNVQFWLEFWYRTTYYIVGGGLWDPWAMSYAFLSRSDLPLYTYDEFQRWQPILINCVTKFKNLFDHQKFAFPKIEVPLKSWSIFFTKIPTPISRTLGVPKKGGNTPILALVFGMKIKIKYTTRKSCSCHFQNTPDCYL